MRVKKILSLAVVLAMVMAVVPMFGITASAAAGDVEVGYHIDYTINEITSRYKVISGTNLITNADFTNGFEGWTGAENGTVVTSFNKVGDAIQQKTSSSGGSANSTIRRIIPATKGTTYYVAYTLVNNTGNKISNDDKNGNSTGMKGIFAAELETGKTGFGNLNTSTTGLTMYGTKTNGGRTSWNTQLTTVDGTENYNLRDDGTWEIGENREEHIITIPDDATNPVIVISFGAQMQSSVISKISFKNFTVQEAVKAEPDASVKVTYQDTDGNTLSEDVITSLYSGDEYTYVPSVVSDEKHEIFYKPNDGQDLTIKALTSAENTLTVKCSKMTFATVEIPSRDSTVTVDGDKYKVIGDKNIIPNPSFETSDNKFTMAGWYSAKDGAPYENGGTTIAYKIGKGKYYYFKEDEDKVQGTENSNYSSKHGEWSFGSRYNNGEDYSSGSSNGYGLCSIRNNFIVGNNKTMYLSFYTKAYTDDDAILTWGASNGVNAGKAAEQGRLKYDNTADAGYNDWKKVEAIITTGNDTDCVQFSAFWLGKGKEGQGPYFLFDEFVLVEVEEATKDITVNYQADGSNIVSTEKVIVNDLDTQYTPVAGTIVKDTDGKLYYVGVEDRTKPDNGAKTVEITDGSATVAVTALTDVFTVQDGKVLTSKLTDDIKYLGDNNFGAFNWEDTGYDRVGVAVLDVKDLTADIYALSADKVRFSQDARGNAAHSQKVDLELYAISYDTFKNLDLTKKGSIENLLTDGNQVAKFVDDDSNFFGSEFSKDKTEKVVITLDGAGIKKAAGGTNKVVLLGNAHNALYGLAAEGLKIVSASNVAVTPSLGYNKENGYTVDFTVGDLPDGATVEIYREAEGQDGKDTKVGDPITQESLINNVINVSGSSNAIYKAVAKATVDGADLVLGSADGAVYDLLVKDITANYADKAYKDMDPDKVQAANKIIAKGGLLSEATLVNGADSIMEFDTQNTKKVAIKVDYTKLGIGFIVESGEIYIGADAKTVTEGTDGGSYAYLEITENGVTLSGKIENGEVKTNEAITLSLDSVNIEFVETLIEELEANGADTEADFIPEL